MEDQVFINWALGILGMLLGFMLRVMWQSVKDLQSSDKDILDRIGSVEILVAGEYLKREEFSRLSNKIFNKLDRIEEKLDQKEDKK